MKTVMILAGESSGELYGALLAKALRRKWPDIRLIGIGGNRMQDAGVELIARTSDAFGLIEAVSSIGKIKTALRKAQEALHAFKPSVLVPIDYPDFNLKVAATAKLLGVKIVYYVSPQVWAWRRSRIKKIARLVDRMTVVLPFEEKIYRDAGVRCEFVGHPVFEEIEAVLHETVLGQKIRDIDEASFGMSSVQMNAELRADIKNKLGFDGSRPLLSVLPGSRPSELKRHLPVIAETIIQFRRDHEATSGMSYQCCIPLAPNTDDEAYGRYLENLRREDVVVRKGESVKVLAASDIAVVASGTATLQTALLEVPMVVIYKLSPLTYQLGKRIVKVPYISLVNILTGKKVVQELLQERVNPEEIVKELMKIVSDRRYRGDMVAELRKIKGQFSGKRPSERVAEIVMELAGEKIKNASQ